MNKKTLFVLSLGWFLAGCVTPGPERPLVCEPYKWEKKECSPNQDPNVPFVNLNTKTLKVSPYCVRAKKGTFILFRIKGKPKSEIGTVEISPKPDKDGKTDTNSWLKGKNYPYDDLIIIPVPENLEPGERAYKITTSTKCVDPRVSVEN